MTVSPRLPAGLVRHVIETEVQPADAEMNHMVELALRRGARRVAIGRGRSTVAAGAAALFARRWEAGGGTVLDHVTWPEEAASWLRQATRFAAADPDLWVMAGAPRGWAQMTRRLLWSTPWQPGRTIAFAALGTERAIELVGAHNLSGLAGATPEGGTWTVCNGNIRTAAPSREITR
jgi:Periplasmic binding protein